MMEKLKVLSIEAVGGILTAEIYADDGRYVGHIFGQRIPFAKVLDPGQTAPIAEEEDYGPVELSADTEPELIQAIKEIVTSDIGNVIRMNEAP